MSKYIVKTGEYAPRRVKPWRKSYMGLQAPPEPDPIVRDIRSGQVYKKNGAQECARRVRRLF